MPSVGSRTESLIEIPKLSVSATLCGLGYSGSALKASAKRSRLFTIHCSTNVEHCMNAVERGWPNALDFSLDFTQHSTHVLFDEQFFYGMLCSLLNELQLRMPMLDNFALDQTSLDK